MESTVQHGRSRTMWEATELSCAAFQRYGKPAVHTGSKLIRVYCTQPYQDYAPAIARLAGEIIDRYESVVGRVEPLTLNIAFAEGDFPGYFSYGLILLSGSDLQDFAGNSRSRSFYKLLAHEIGHLWWHPSMYRLEDLTGAQWYVEGFTEYASVWSTGKVYGVSEYERRLDYAIERIRNTSRLKPMSEYSYWDYSGFFDHWIRGVEPAELLIIDLKDTGVGGARLLTLQSNQTLPVPLEIAVKYPDRTEVVTADIEAGRSEINVPVKPGASMLELDPNRTLFRTEPLLQNPVAILEPVRM